MNRIQPWLALYMTVHKQGDQDLEPQHTVRADSELDSASRRGVHKFTKVKEPVAKVEAKAGVDLLQSSRLSDCSL